jgi:hypothetical protein
MKCKRCGNYIKTVKCHVFTYDGSDDYINVPILKPKVKGTCYYLRGIPKNLTMFEFEEYYEEFKSNISCPKCGNYPFKEESINIVECADVIFGVSKEKEINQGY